MQLEEIPPGLGCKNMYYLVWNHSRKSKLMSRVKGRLHSGLSVEDLCPVGQEWIVSYCFVARLVRTLCPPASAGHGERRVAVSGEAADCLQWVGDQAGGPRPVLIDLLPTCLPAAVQPLLDETARAQVRAERAICLQFCWILSPRQWMHSTEGAVLRARGALIVLGVKTTKKA